MFNYIQSYRKYNNKIFTKNYTILIKNLFLKMVTLTEERLHGL